MNTPIPSSMRRIRRRAAAALVGGMAAGWRRTGPGARRMRPPRLHALQGAALHMEISPRLGGRVLRISVPGMPNLLRTGEAALQAQPDPPVRPDGDNNIPYRGHEVWWGRRPTGGASRRSMRHGARPPRSGRRIRGWRMRRHGCSVRAPPGARVCWQAPFLPGAQSLRAYVCLGIPLLLRRICRRHNRRCRWNLLPLSAVHRLAIWHCRGLRYWNSPRPSPNLRLARNCRKIARSTRASTE